MPLKNLKYRVKQISLNNCWESKEDKNCKKAREDIVFEIFYNCIPHIEDEYWKEIFEQASQNRFPRLFTFQNGYLTYTNSNKRKKIKVSNIPQEAIPSCISFFQTHGGMFSNLDKSQMTLQRENNIDESKLLENCKWTDIKRNKVKTLLIENYIDRLAKTYNISDKDKITLETTIHIGFMLKYFDNKDVVFENGRIQQINGLIYDSHQNNFIIDPKLELSKSKKKIQLFNPYRAIDIMDENKPYPFDKVWEKFLKFLYKEYYNGINETSTSESHESQSEITES